MRSQFRANHINDSMLIEDLVTWLRYNVLLENGDIMSFSVGYCVVCPFSITDFDYPFRMLKLFLGLYLKFGLYLIYSGFSLARFYFISLKFILPVAEWYTDRNWSLHCPIGFSPQKWTDINVQDNLPPGTLSESLRDNKGLVIPLGDTNVISILPRTSV